MRTATIQRKTSETSIEVELNLDGTGLYQVSTGIGFLDHMLEQLSRHSLIDLKVKTVGEKLGGEDTSFVPIDPKTVITLGDPSSKTVTDGHW